jgi:hypothetical protein
MYRANRDDFLVWLEQPIWINGIERAERKNYIGEFTALLTKYMKVYGYTMNRFWTPSLVAKWLYRIAVQVVAKNKPYEIIRYEHLQDSFTRQEDIDQFYHVIESNSCKKFCERMQGIEDLDPTSRMGSRVWFEVESFLRNYLDIEHSAQTRIVDRAFYDSDSDSESIKEGGTDKYIQEVSEGYHGGRGYKV